MDYRLLGKSDLKVSRIGFGCMSLTDNDDENNSRLLMEAVEKGINFFDTADLYQHGRNETCIGKTFSKRRKDIIIATKVGNQWRPDGKGWDWNPRREYILQSVEDSLKRLQTDYIDLYQLHGGTMNDPVQETIEAFELLKKQGKIRHYGISSIRPNVIRSYSSRSNICSVMMQYSLLDRRPEESCLGILHDKQIGMLARGSLASGLLINKAPTPYLNYNAAEVEKAAAAIQQASGQNRRATQTALQFILRRTEVSSAIVGIRTLEQLEAAVLATTVESITSDEIVMLENTVPLNYYQDHR